jgi:single-strand DNA-binding protein
LTQDPELKYTANGKATARFSLAVDRATTAKETDFFNITAWERLAETCGRYLAKGKLVVIEGRLQNREYTGNDGQQRKVTEIVASDMRMLGSKGDNPAGERAPMHEQAPAAAGQPARPAAAKPVPVPAHGPDEGLDDLGMDDIPF